MKWHFRRINNLLAGIDIFDLALRLHLTGRVWPTGGFSLAGSSFVSSRKVNVDSVTIGIGTLAAVLVTHWLGQRRGQQRLNRVRDEFSLRLNAIDLRLTEVQRRFNPGMAATNQVRTDLQGSIARLKAVTDSSREVSVRGKLAAQAEILGLLSQHGNHCVSARKRV